MSIAYVTGNQSKFQNASAFLQTVGVTIYQASVPVDEIQAGTGIEVAIRKAHDAYAQLREPLFINDAEWAIPALGGFPGPYMKYIVGWLTQQDLLKLMEEKADRSLILRDTVVYYDGSVERVFTHEVHGKILTSPQGEPRGPFVTQIFSLRRDGKSIAEDTTIGFSEDEAILWAEFATWLKTHIPQA